MTADTFNQVRRELKFLAEHIPSVTEQGRYLHSLKMRRSELRIMVGDHIGKSPCVAKDNCPNYHERFLTSCFNCSGL